MLKSFFRETDGDVPTPKASDQKNPFDALSPANGAKTPSTSRKASFTSGIPPQTPTAGGFKSFWSGSSQSGSQNGPKDVPTVATASLSKAEPDFTLSTNQSASAIAQRRQMQTHPSLVPSPQQESYRSPQLQGASPDSSKDGTSPASTQSSSHSIQPQVQQGQPSNNPGFPRGRLSLKIIQARNLACRSSQARPHVVASYDQNEFVGREPINEHEAPPGTVYVPRSGAQTPVRGSPPKGSGNGFLTSKDGMLSGSMAHTALTKSLEKHRISEQRKTHVRGNSIDSARQASPESSPISAYHPTWKQEVIFDVVSEGQPIMIAIFDRMHDECFLGAVDVNPRLVPGQEVDLWLKLVPRGDEKVTGEIRLQYRYDKSDTKRSLNVKDFEFLRMIGKGTFGRVFQVRKKDTRRIYAMKVLSKREIIAKKEVAHTIGERKILQRSSECPFLLGLKFSFQSEGELYLVMDYKSGGELFHHLQQEGRFAEDRARFYTAEIVLAFEHLHKYDIVYRDLKPENILLDATGHIVLCDFGLSKPDLPSDALTNTFCGTTEYLAPEVLLDDHGYSKLVDFWSLGVLLFEMCCGWSPFYAEDTQQMYKNICFGKIKFPRGVIGDDGKQFVKSLLNRNPRHRLGAHRDTDELKEHAFFSPIDWLLLSQRKVVPPFTPFVDSDESVANFDAEFTEADITKEAPKVVFDDNDRSNSWIGHASSMSESNGMPMASRHHRHHDSAGSLSGSAQDAFRGFSYAGSMDERPSFSKFRMTAADESD